MALGSIPGVRVRSVWGSADLIPKSYYARIDVAGAPSAFIYRLTRRSFDEGGELCFFQVGEYAVRYSAYGRLWVQGSRPRRRVAMPFVSTNLVTSMEDLPCFP